MKFIGIIPARYASTRFPGKPLADINGKSMIQRVYEQASKSLDKVVVATDDERIFNAVKEFGGQVVMTSENHKSGTDRCAEAAKKIGLPFDDQTVVINIQGDEPFIKPEQIEELKSCFDSPETQIASLGRVIIKQADMWNENIPKIVLNANSEAMYFSRSTIPFVRGVEKVNWNDQYPFLAHIGIYAYRTDILAQIVKLQMGTLEQLESLEQLRWLENGYKVKINKSKFLSHGVDTPEDLEKVKKLFV